MLGQPQQCYDALCPLAGKGRGFVLPSGPVTAPIAILLDTPDPNDLVVLASDEEITRRRKLYPELDEQYLRKGVGGGGKSSEIWQWAGAAAGINQAQVYVSHTLRCLPPFDGKSAYPTGAIRKKSEACCQQYSRWADFKPTVSVHSLRPDSVLIEPTPLPLQITSLRKARDFASAGERVVVIAGGKSAQQWLGFGSNEARFVGSYEIETEAVALRREIRREEGMKVSVIKKPKVAKIKKLTVRQALLNLLNNLTYKDAGNAIDEPTYVLHSEISRAEYDEMLSLTKTVSRKTKAINDSSLS